VKNRDEWNSLVIATTDSFQGGDNRIAFSDYVVTDKMGFLNDRGRQTVSSTRAKDFWFGVGLDENMLRDECNTIKHKLRHADPIFQSWPMKIYSAFTKRGRSRKLEPDNPLLQHPWITSMSTGGDDEIHADESATTWGKYKTYLASKNKN